MSIVLNGTTHQLRSASFGASRPSAYSIAGWFKFDSAPSTSSTESVLSVGNSAFFPTDAGDLILTWGHGTPDNRNRVVMHLVGSTYVSTNTGADGTPLVWKHRAAVFTGSEVGFYENGSLVGSLRSASVTAAAPADWVVEVGSRSFQERMTGGKAAYIGYWDVALSAVEIASLGKGFSPRLARPQSLRFFLPGLRNANALVGSVATAANLTFSDDNPRIYA